MEQYAIECAKWLEKRVLQAEAKKPKLRLLKNRINELSAEMKISQEDKIPDLIRQQNEVIQELVAL
jgi:hypothetical protein